MDASVNNIPIVIGNFNQLSYLKIMVAQLKYYLPDNRICIVDNASTYQPLLDYYWKNTDFTVYTYTENDFVKNMTDFIKGLDSEYYILSDPDISIHPATPPFFLEVFKELIDSGYHHVGFDLIYDDLPEWNKKAAWIAGDEKNLHNQPVEVKYNGYTFTGFHAAIDTTFALYSSKNGGWSAPMPGKDWGNSVRIFKAHHLPWYLHPEYVNEEMKNYFNTCRRHDGGVSAGKNNHSPFNT